LERTDGFADDMVRVRVKVGGLSKFLRTSVEEGRVRSLSIVTSVRNHCEASNDWHGLELDMTLSRVMTSSPLLMPSRRRREERLFTMKTWIRMRTGAHSSRRLEWPLCVKEYVEKLEFQSSTSSAWHKNFTI